MGLIPMVTGDLIDKIEWLLMWVLIATIGLKI